MSIITNLGNFDTFDELEKINMRELTNIKLLDIKFTEKFINSIPKFINLKNIDLSDNRSYYIKKYIDLDKYILMCEQIKKYDIFGERFLNKRNEIISFAKQLGFNCKKIYLNNLFN
jgi:hypothetical protein